MKAPKEKTTNSSKQTQKTTKNESKSKMKIKEVE